MKRTKAAKRRKFTTPSGATIELRLPGAADACDVAKRYIEKGLLDPAAAELERVLGDDPEDFEAHGLLGTVRLAQDRYPEAIRHLERATRLDPTDAFWQYKLGVAYEWHGDLDRATQHLQAATELRDGFGAAHAELGCVLNTAGNAEEAAAQWETAISLDTEVAEAYGNLGAHYVNLGRVEEAVPLLEKAASIGTPQLAGMAHFALGMAFLSLKRPKDDVHREFKKGAELGNEQAIEILRRVAF